MTDIDSAIAKLKEEFDEYSSEGYGAVSVHRIIDRAVAICRLHQFRLHALIQNMHTSYNPGSDPFDIEAALAAMSCRADPRGAPGQNEECCARVEREDLPAKAPTNVERPATKDLAQVRLEEGKAIVTVAGVEVRSFCHADRESLALSLALNINRAHQAAAAAQPTEADVERVARAMCVAEDLDPDKEVESGWDEWVGRRAGWRAFENLAKIAIAAMPPIVRPTGLTAYDREGIMESLRKAAAGKYELDTGDEWAIGHAADILAPYLVSDARF